MKYNVVLVCCPDDFIRNSRDYARSAEIHTKGSADRTIRFWSCGRLHKVNIALNFIFFLSRWFRFLTWPPSFICKLSPTEDGYYSLFRWWTYDVLVNAFFSLNWLFLAVVLLFWVRYLFLFSASLCCSTINQSILIKKFNQYWFKNYKLSKTQLVWGCNCQSYQNELTFLQKESNFFYRWNLFRMIHTSLESVFTQLNFFLHNLAQIRFFGHEEGALLSFIPKTYRSDSLLLSYYTPPCMPRVSNWVTNIEKLV